MPPLPQVLIALFCAWRCADLIVFWKTAPNSEFFGWVVLAIWLLPLFLSRRRDQGVPFLSCAGLGFAALGMLGDFNILEHVGFALSIVAMLPWTRFSPIWMLSAVSWMPAFTWFAGYLVLEYSFVGRCVLVTANLALYLMLRRRVTALEVQ